MFEQIKAEVRRRLTRKWMIVLVVVAAGSWAMNGVASAEFLQGWKTAGDNLFQALNAIDTWSLGRNYIFRLTGCDVVAFACPGRSGLQRGEHVMLTPVISLWHTVSTMWASAGELQAALFGFSLVVAGIALYAWWKREDGGMPSLLFGAVLVAPAASLVALALKVILILCLSIFSYVLGLVIWVITTCLFAIKMAMTAYSVFKTTDTVHGQVEAVVSTVSPPTPGKDGQSGQPPRSTS